MREYILQCKVLLLFLAYVAQNCALADTITSTQSGDFDAGSTWVGGTAPSASDNVVIASGHTIDSENNNDACVNLTVNSGGVLICTKDLAISGNTIINGSVTGGKSMQIAGGASITLSGAGSIDCKSVIVSGALSIASGTTISYVKKMDIDDGVTVTNSGSITINDIKGGGGSATWVQAANSTVKVKDIMKTGVLTASASGNTVEINTMDGEFNGTTYYNLKITGSGTHTTSGNVIVTNLMTLAGGILNTESNDFTITGSYTNSGGTLTESTNDFTFSGTANQTITAVSDETFYNLIVNKSSGTLTLANNITVSNILTMTDGLIDASTNSKKLTLGTGTGVVGTLSYAAGSVYGEFEKWYSAAGSFTYPVGDGTNYQPVLVSFDNMTTAGSYSVEMVTTAPGTTGLSLDDGGTTIYNTFSNGYFDCEALNSLASSSFDIDITATGFNAFTIDAATRILYRTSGGASWTANGAHESASGSTVKRDNCTTPTGHFAVGDDTNCTGPSTSAMTGTAEYCTSVTGKAYSVTNTAGSTYAWTIVGGTQASGTNTNSITVDWGATGRADASVAVVETNACTAGAVVSKTVVLNSIAPTSIAGANVIAENTTGEAYSVTNNTAYTYTWTISGGTKASGGSTNAITVDWGSTGIGNITVTATKSGCAASSDATLVVDKYVVIDTDLNPSGNLNATSSWDCACTPTSNSNIRIVNGDSLIVTADQTLNHFTIDVGGVVYLQAGVDLIVNGNFTVNGKLYVNDRDIDLDGNTTIDGIGTIIFESDKDLACKNAGKTIKSTCVLNVTGGGFKIDADGLTITNSGNINIAKDITTSKTGAIWTNAANSTLVIGEDLNATGAGDLTLNASATGNTVSYTSTGSKTIFTPSTSTYYNLKTAGGTHALPANLTISNDLTVVSGTFTHGSNYALTVAGDISVTGTFTAGTGTVTLNGAAAQTIGYADGTTTLTVGALTVNNTTSASAITLGSPVTVSGICTFTDGHLISTASDPLNIGSSGSISGGSDGSHVSGTIIHNFATASSREVNFPLGTGSVLHQVDLTCDHSASTATAYTASFTNSSAVDLGLTLPGTVDRVSAKNYFDIAKGAGASLDGATVKLFYVSTDGVSDAANLAVLKSDGAGGWTDLSGTASGSPTGSITSTSFTTFSKFALGNKSGGGNALPVEMLSFDAFELQEAVELEWITGAEVNNDYFSVEKSSDATNWEEIGKIPGAGNSNVEKVYHFIDEAPYIGINYYRIKQTDYDGLFKYTFVKAIKFGEDPVTIEPELIIFPNPSANGKVNLKIANGLPNANIRLEIVDQSGKIWKRETHYYTNSDGKFELKLDEGDHLSEGIYFVTFESTNFSVTRKLVNH